MRATTSAWPASSSWSTAHPPGSRTRPRPTRWRGTRAAFPTVRTRSPQGRPTPRATRSCRPPVNVNVSNTSSFQNEILATGFNLPTAMKFLPDGRMLVVGAAGHDQGAAAAVHDARPDAVPAADQHRLRRGAAGRSTTSRSTPNFATNHYYYIFYTLGIAEPRPPLAVHRQRDAHRHGRRQRAGALPGSAGRQRRAPRRRDQLRQRRQAVLHDRRALRRRRRARPAPARAARSTASTRTAPSRPTTRSTTAPGRTGTRSGRSGLRNPYRAYYDAPTGRLFIGDVGGNDYATASEEVDVGARGANYGWPNCEGACVSRRARARSTPIRTTAATPPSPAASSTTATSSRARTRAATSSPTTRRTGSSA